MKRKFSAELAYVSGISARSYLERHTAREFLVSRTEKLLVPSTLGLFTFQFIQGIVIPAKARKLFGISVGDQLVVLGDEGQGIAVMKANDFLALADMVRKSGK